MKKSTQLLVVAGLAALTAAPALAQHEDDVELTIVDNRIVTEGRVFEAEFGDSGIFNFTDDPGFDSENGTFQANSMVGFNVTGAFRIWNGNGFDNAVNTLTISFGALEIVVGSDPFTPGFGINANASGRWHRHLNYTLNDVTPTSDPAIYLLELELWNQGTGVETSLPFWKVFAFGDVTHQEHEAAVDWVQANLVPAPGAVALLGLAGLAGLGRRRRQH